MSSQVTFTIDKPISIDARAKRQAFISSVAKRKYGFVNQLHDQQVDHVRVVCSEISWADTLVVVGIGGSDLGGRALQNALQVAPAHGNAPVRKLIFHGEFTDPDSLEMLLGQIDLDKTVFNIVSKSGGTVETMSQYYFLQEWVKTQVGAEWQKHFLFSTDPEQGLLRAEANATGVKTLPVPSQVGGRFSVLTEVGLLPAIWMGWDAEQLIQGARDALQNLNETSPAIQIAEWQFAALGQGKQLSVMLPYAQRLTEFGRWYRQLWAESTGKDGKGILPIQARGPADQHSQLQFYQDGPDWATFLFVRVEKFNTEYTIPNVETEKLKFISGKTFGELTNVELEASRRALHEAWRATATLSLTQLDAYAVGALLTTFMLGVSYLCDLLEVNAFDQPGVEASKILIKEILQS